MSIFMKKFKKPVLTAEDYTPADNVALEVRNLTVQYIVDGEVSEAATDISFKVEEGKTLGIVGETGAGKTTTALACLNMVPDPPGVIQSGHVYVCGTDVLLKKEKEMEEILGRDIAMIFQDPMTSLNPLIPVKDQIAESILLHTDLSAAEAEEKALQNLELVGIPRERGKEYPFQFSGGMKQRVMIAVALACNPKVLICDEPTTALDVTIQAQVLNLMTELRQKFNSGMIMITHDLGIVANTCDDVIVMYAGRIIERGTVWDLFEDTRHPYTEGLFNSLPDVEDRKSRLKPIPGMMPDPAHLPQGCAFADRCPYAAEACRQARPEEKWISETHAVACSRYDEPDFMIERSKKA